MSHVRAPGQDILREMRDSFVIYKTALEILDRAGIPYVVGGGIAVMSYSRRRVTKDIDIYLDPVYIDTALRSLEENGFDINALPDVQWLSKAYSGGICIDFILENIGGIKTTAETIRRGRYRNIGKYTFFVMSPEDLILRKLMAMRSDRDDWYDSYAVLSETYTVFDWDYFIMISRPYVKRALSFLLFVISDNERRVPVPSDVIGRLVELLKVV